MHITTPGVYQFEWRSQVGNGTNTTEHNDTWLRINGDQFYGYEASTDTYVRPPSAAPGTYPDGAAEAHGGWNDGGWFKVFSSKQDWTWSTKTNDGSYHDIFVAFDEPGVYEIEIAARSSSHVIDRLVLHHVDHAGDPHDLNLPVSEWVDPEGAEPGLPDTVAVYLIDAATDARVADIRDGGNIDLSKVESGQYAIEVVPGGAANVGSVALSLNGAAPRVENGAPYALFGDLGGDFVGGTLTAGAHDLSVTLYAGANGTGASTTLDLSFDAQETGGGDETLALYFIDPLTGKRVGEISEGGTLSAERLSAGLFSIEADPGQSAGSVKLTWSNGPARIENIAPYALFGDTDGAYGGGLVVAGDQSVTVEVYAGGGASGALLASETIAFTVDDTSPAPAPDTGDVSVFLFDAAVNSRAAEIEDGDHFTADILYRDTFSLAVETTRTDVRSARLTWLDEEGRILHQEVESTEPYTLFGDSNGQVIDEGLAILIGDQSLRVELFTGANATGQKVVDQTTSFTMGEALPNPVKPDPQIDLNGLAAQADRVIFDYDGNQGDPDDIAAMPIVALMAKAAGITDKTTFLYGNSGIVAGNASNDLLPLLEQSAEFSRSLGIDAYSYQDDIDGTIDRLINMIESGDDILLIEAGRLDGIYAALSAVDPIYHQNVTMLSHSIWNENGSTPTWSDMEAEFEDVTFVRIADQNNGPYNTEGFRNEDWQWMDGSDDPWVQEARDLMELAGPDKVNDPSDAGMLYYALTGDEHGTALDVQALIDGSAVYDDPVTAAGDDGRSPTGAPPSPPTGTTGAFVERNGLLIIEAESGGTPVGWEDAASSSTSGSINSPGQATGGDFIVWEGDNHYDDPTNGVITYQIEITTPGLYQFEWRSQVGQGTNTTEHNDTWLKINADMFYGHEAATDTYVRPPSLAVEPGSYPSGAEFAHGGWNDEGYFKVFSSRNDWTWSTKTSDGSFYDLYAQFDAPGLYEIQIAARSSHHVIDRLVLHHVDYEGDPYDLSLSESDRAGEAAPPPAPDLPMEIDVYLIDAESDERLAEITDGARVDLATGGAYNIEVVIPEGSAAAVGSVSISIDGSEPRVENTAPYASFGDLNGDFASGPLTPGAKELSIEVFSGSDRTGQSTRFDLAFDATVGGTPPAPRLELGTADIAQSDPDGWVRVDFDAEIADAVVVMGPLSANGSEPATVRVRNVEETGFEFQVDEWEYLDGVHAPETVSWMAATAGVHRMADGTVVAAGSATARDDTREAIDFGATFDEAPAFFAQVTTDNGPQAVTTRALDVTADGAQVFLQEEEASDQTHTSEQVDWIAIDTSATAAWEIGTLQVSDAAIDLSYDLDNPVILAGLQTAAGPDTATLRIAGHADTGTTIWLSEEQSADSETAHVSEVARTLIGMEESYDLFA
ncbi:MAG: hypothetical protein AAGI50_00665 [Pseudomonadota bacterium]